MTHSIQVNAEGTATLRVDFSDENVPLQGETTVQGGEAEALAYLPVFEADLRRNFANRYPALLPEAETAPPTLEEGMMP